MRCSARTWVSGFPQTVWPPPVRAGKSSKRLGTGAGLAAAAATAAISASLAVEIGRALIGKIVTPDGAHCPRQMSIFSGRLPAWRVVLTGDWDAEGLLGTLRVGTLDKDG